jgi:hypothetical protein
MAHELYEIWENPDSRIGTKRWRLQLIGYVGRFSNEESAQKYADEVKKFRKANGLDTPNSVHKAK